MDINLKYAKLGAEVGAVTGGVTTFNLAGAVAAGGGGAVVGGGAAAATQMTWEGIRFTVAAGDAAHDKFSKLAERWKRREEVNTNIES